MAFTTTTIPLRIYLANAGETREFGAAISRLLIPGDVLLLEGELGAGKTTFTQGLAAGLGITSDVLSPTFALMSEYRQGRVPLLHVDAYRLMNASEAEHLGLDEYLDSGWVAVVEWAGNVAGALPADALEMLFEYEGEARSVTLRANGKRSLEILEEYRATGPGH